MKLLKKLIVAGICSFSLLFSGAIAPLSLANAYQESVSTGYQWIVGTWQGRDGSILDITNSSFGKASYSINEVSNDGTYTVVTISVNGGRSINTLTFSNDNPSYMMLNNLTTGYTADFSKNK